MPDGLAVPDGWALSADGVAISRTVVRDSFPSAVNFVVRVAELAEAMDHHPDIDIRYTKVTFTLTTHSAGELTARDITAAHQINDLAMDLALPDFHE